MVAIKKQMRNIDSTYHYSADILAKAIQEFKRLVQEFKDRYDMVHQSGGLFGAYPMLIHSKLGMSEDGIKEGVKGNLCRGDLKSHEAQSYPMIPLGSISPTTRAEDARASLDAN